MIDVFVKCYKKRSGVAHQQEWCRGVKRTRVLGLEKLNVDELRLGDPTQISILKFFERHCKNSSVPR